MVALFTLGKSPENREKLFDLGAVQVIIVGMRRHPMQESLQEAACAALINTCGNYYGSVKLGVADELLRCLEVYLDNVGIQINACQAISSLAFSPFAAFYLVEAHVGQLLQRTMKKHSSKRKVLTAACSAIWTLCSHASSATNLNDEVTSSPETNTAKECRSILFKIGLAFNVMEALKLSKGNKHTDLIENCLGAIWSLDHPFSFAKLGASELITKVLKTFDENIVLVDLCCNILSRFSEISSISKQLIDLDTTKILVAILRKEQNQKNVQLQEIGCLTLSNFAFWDDCRVEVYNSKASKVALQSLTNFADNSEIVEVAVCILGNIALLQAASQKYLEKKVHKIVVEIANKHKENEGVQANTIFFLRNLAKFDKLRLIPLVGSIPLIESALERFPKNEMLEIIGREALQNLGKHKF